MEIELIGGYEKNELETRIQKVATAGKLSRFPGNVFEVLESCNNYEKNLNLIKRIIGMGHKSIIEHDYLVFAICDVTPIIEQTIIGNRLTSFTIKSRREVDFRTAGFYIPEFRNKDLNTHPKNEELKQKYISHMKSLFNTYGDLVDILKPTEDRHGYNLVEDKSQVVEGVLSVWEIVPTELVRNSKSNATDEAEVEDEPALYDATAPVAEVDEEEVEETWGEPIV